MKNKEENKYIENKDDVVLRVENVSKSYILGAVTGGTLRDTVKEKIFKRGINRNRSFTALDNVSFEARTGETIGLIGANGAGKSTLLKLISRITAPTKGRIFIDGRVSSMLEVGTGFHHELPGRENIYLNGSILGMSKSEIDKKIKSIIEFSECEDFIDTPVKRYSSGMYVKLAFAIASHLESEIMIMDEVLAVGDIKFQRKCLDKMKEISETEGRTVLYVSHNLDTVQRLCKRCLVLDHGKLCYDGDVEEATRIYYGYNDSNDIYKEFGNVLRPTWLVHDEARMLSAENLGFSETENKLKLRIRWKCEETLEKLSFRFELMDENHRTFAVSFAHGFFSGAAGCEAEAIFSIDLSHVVDGEYETYYTLFCTNAYGEGIDIDWVKGLNVTVNRKTGIEPIKWDRIHWGNVTLEPICVEQIKKQ